MIEQRLVTFLLTKEDVTDLIDDRIYPQLAPDNEQRVMIIYTRTNTTRNYSHSGNSGLTTARLDVECWGGRGSTGYGTAKTLAEAVRVALDGFRGNMGVEHVKRVLIEDEADLLEILDAGFDMRGVVLRISIQFVEATTIYE